MTERVYTVKGIYKVIGFGYRWRVEKNGVVISQQCNVHTNIITDILMGRLV